MRVVELDILRFAAAIAVVFFHYFAWFTVDIPLHDPLIDNAYSLMQLGFLGVPLFFMISGYVIMASASHRTTYEFTVSRMARLYPVYWLSVIMTAAFLLITSIGNPTFTLTDFLVNLTMVQDFVGIQNIDSVYWTLAKELQFYACVFLLMLFGVIRYTKTWVLVWLLLTTTFFALKQPFFMGWFISPEYSPFFIAGVCFYMVRFSEEKIIYRRYLYCAFLLACFSIFRESDGFLAIHTDYYHWLCVAIVGLFFLIFASFNIYDFRITPKPIYAVLGAMTYPLYLVHNKIGKIMMTSSLEHISPITAITLTTVVMMILSFLIYHYYEHRVATPLKGMLLSFGQKNPQTH